ncbi:hypothetical protein N505_0115415 [Rhodococcus aetherivorans]|nr:hypothetical protein N505_0115415 [Rhodococcus aetherivorans]
MRSAVDDTAAAYESMTADPGVSGDRRVVPNAGTALETGVPLHDGIPFHGDQSPYDRVIPNAPTIGDD